MESLQGRVRRELRLGPDAPPNLAWLGQVRLESARDGRARHASDTPNLQFLDETTGEWSVIGVRRDAISVDIERLGGRWRPATSALGDLATGRATVIDPADLDRARPFRVQADAAMGELLVGGAGIGQQHMPRAPRTVGNRAELLVRNEQYLPRLYHDLVGARRSITIAQFNWEPDGSGRAVIDLLKEQARAGLDVRVMVDAWGFRERGFKAARALQDELESAGVRVERSWPYRPGHGWEHRKLIGIDDRIAYTGGLGFGAKYDSWTDLMVRAEGPAGAVAGTHALATWRDLGGPHDANAAARLLDNRDALRSPAAVEGGGAAVTMLENRPGVDLAATEGFLRDAKAARTRLWATSTYITTPTAVEALKDAARRGVNTKLLVTGLEAGNDVKIINLARTFYAELLESGVEIYERQTGILHAKSWLSDETTSVGSMNLSHSSMTRAREVMTRVEDTEFAASYARFHTEARSIEAGSRLVTAESLTGRGLRHLTAARRVLGLRF